MNPYLRPLTDDVVSQADRAYWDKYGTEGVWELQDGDAESLASMRAALEAVWPQRETLPTAEQLAAADARRQSFRSHVLFLLAAQGAVGPAAEVVADTFIVALNADGLHVTRFLDGNEVIARLSARAARD